MYTIDQVRESNRIEQILREPTEAEINEFDRFMELDTITLDDLKRFVFIYQPTARFRNQVGLDVCIGNHIPPLGGPDILRETTILLLEINGGNDSFVCHNKYEKLHPFTDGNGRSGRMLWYWQNRLKPSMIFRGFLHSFYYQSLEHFRS